MVKNISVVGLGKLGLPLATCLAESGFNVFGVDINADIINALNNGISPYNENGLQELIEKNLNKKFIPTDDHKDALIKSDVTIILVATPCLSDGSYSNKYVIDVLKTLSIAFKESNKKNHIFVISCTVLPGSINNIFIPLIEKYSGKKLNIDFSVCYDPDFVALGNVINDFFNPDIVVIGESNVQAGGKMQYIHQKMCRNNPYIKRMSIISAEIAKVSLNAYVTTKISFVNNLANLCEKIRGADVDSITEAIGHDRRISPYYFRGGTSFGGTCFPRDTWAFIEIAKKYNNKPSLTYAVQEINNRQDEHLYQIVLDVIKRNKCNSIGILGLSFKPKTPVITESPAIKLIEKLINKAKHIQISVYDELSLDNVKDIFKNNINYFISIEDCLNNCEVCVITYMEKEFKRKVEEFEPKNKMTIIDPWRQIDVDKLNNNINYIPLGKFIE